MTDKEIGQRIKELRKNYNLTRDNLAELLDISPGHVRLIEVGERGTTTARYIALSSMFHVSLDYLLAGRGHAPCSIENEYIDHLKPILDEHELNCITKFATAFSLYRHTSKGECSPNNDIVI